MPSGNLIVDKNGQSSQQYQPDVLIVGGGHNQERYPLASCRKVFVQRDYSQGLPVRFQIKLPPELDGKIEEGTWERTVTEMNRMYAEGEKVGARSAAESLFSCLTCYLSNLCLVQQYDRALQRIARYLKEQNETIYIPRGIFLTDPIERGLRIIEISILTEPSQPVNSSFKPIVATTNVPTTQPDSRSHYA